MITDRHIQLRKRGRRQERPLPFDLQTHTRVTTKHYVNGRWHGAREAVPWAGRYVYWAREMQLSPASRLIGRLITGQCSLTKRGIHVADVELADGLGFVKAAQEMEKSDAWAVTL
jgi:hypothetical protein